MIVTGEEIFKQNQQRIAKLHYDSLTTSLISALGISAVNLYYQYICRSHQDYIFLIEEDGEVSGVCVLSLEPGSLMKRFLVNQIHNLLPLILWRLLTSQEIRKKIWLVLFRSSNKIPAVNNLPEVVQIYTDPEKKNKRIGTRLLTETEKWLLKNGYKKYFLKTLNKEDRSTVFFYKKRGFIEVGKGEDIGKNYVYFTKAL